MMCPGRGFFQQYLIPLLALFFFWVFPIEKIFAQGTPPITSSGLDTQVSGPINLPSGETQYNITGGTRPENGPNLFQSFGEFGVPDNNIANFLNDSGLPTDNILGRVTGGNPSNIFGTIQTEGFPGASLFLMNPAGWVFGPNAALNVEGSVNFTTADYLRQSDGSLFMALSPDQDSQLSIAPVAAFGFLEGQPGTITVQGSNLTVDQGQTISLVSGDITIESFTEVPDGEDPKLATFHASGGEVLLASVASAGEILVQTLDQAPNINGQSFDALGAIQVSEKSAIEVSGDGGGTVRIRGGRFIIDDSTIFANTTGPAEGPLVGPPGEGIDIQVSQDVVIRDAASLETNVGENVASGIGSGGVRIKADRIEILETAPNFDFPFTGIQSNVAFGSEGGPSGDVLLEANSILVRGFGFNTGINTLTRGLGSDAGNIILQATGDIDIDNGGLVSVSGAGGGNSGNIELTSSQGNIFIRDTTDFFGIGPVITSQPLTTSNGKTGNITLSASQGDILVADRASLFTRVTGNGMIAGSGGIELVAKNLTVNNFSSIQIDNFLPLVPGDINVNVSGLLSLENNSRIETTTRGPARSSNLNIMATDVLLSGQSFLSTETFGAGDAGTLNIFTENLQLSDGAQLRSSSTRLNRPVSGEFLPPPSGSGGTINIQGLESPAASVVLEGSGTEIFTDTQGTGNAGNINISTENLQVSNGAEISSSSSIGFTPPGEQRFIPTGSGGTINIGNGSPVASVGIEGTGSGIFTDTVGTGDAGNINILAENLQLTDGGQLSSGTSIGAVPSGQPSFIPTGSGGTINIGNGSPVASVGIEGTGSGIFTDTVGTGDAGSIFVNAIDLTMEAGAEISSSSTRDAADAGDAGTVEIDASNSIALSATSINTSAAQGEGGNIAITSGQSLQLTDGTTVSAESSGAGNSGTVTLVATSGNFSSNNSTVSTTAQEAEGGDIAISAGQDVNLNNGTLVSAQSFGPGNAGGVTLTSGHDINMSNSTISTEAAEASGGNIKLSAPNIIQLTDSRIESSVLGGQATEGGNIDLDPVFIILTNSQILANATAGNGGNITLTATGAVFIDANSVLDASSETGISGNVTVNSPVAALAEVVAALPKNFVIPQSLFADACAAQAGGQFSSFTQGAPAALPPAPGGFLSSPLMLNNLTTPPSTGGMTQSSHLAQSRLGLDFSTISLLPAFGCGA